MSEASSAKLAGFDVPDLTDEHDVGVLPQHGERSPRANVRPERSLTCTWVMPVTCEISTGSSRVTMLRSAGS